MRISKERGRRKGGGGGKGCEISWLVGWCVTKKNIIVEIVIYVYLIHWRVVEVIVEIFEEGVVYFLALTIVGVVEDDDFLDGLLEKRDVCVVEEDSIRVRFDLFIREIVREDPCEMSESVRAEGEFGSILYEILKEVST